MKNYFELCPVVSFDQLGELIYAAEGENRELKIHFKRYDKVMCVLVCGDSSKTEGQYKTYKLEDSNPLDVCNNLYCYLRDNYGSYFTHKKNVEGKERFIWQLGPVTVCFPAEAECQEWIAERIAEIQER
jgi:hypothetical protein